MPEPNDQDDLAQTTVSRRPFGGAFSSSAGKLLASIASQTVIVTAVLFYFGWARVRATYAYFGVDVSVLNFSASDYVLRSVSTAFPPIMAIGLLGIGALLLHSQLHSKFTRYPAFASRFVEILGMAGWVLAAIGFLMALAIRGPAGSEPAGPAAMLVGFTTIVYALFLKHRYTAKEIASPIVVIVSGLLILAFFWAVTAYADYVGNQTAVQLQTELPTAANVRVYSTSDLALAGPGVSESKVSSGSVYRFRYTGLRLLISSGGQYFLLPAGWRPGAGAVIVLPATPMEADMRVQFEARGS